MVALLSHWKSTHYICILVLTTIMGDAHAICANGIAYTCGKHLLNLFLMLLRILGVHMMLLLSNEARVASHGDCVHDNLWGDTFRTFVVPHEYIFKFIKKENCFFLFFRCDHRLVGFRIIEVYLFNLLGPSKVRPCPFNFRPVMD